MTERKTKFCIFCGKEISINAKKCKYCGRWLNEDANDVNDNVKHINFSKKEEEIIQDESKQKECPFCCQMIPFNAQKCQYCGEWIEESDNIEERPGTAFYIFQYISIVVLGIIGAAAMIFIDREVGLSIMIISVLCFILYFLPTYIAYEKKHGKTMIIFLINLIFGATFVGWIVALVWALSNDKILTNGNRRWKVSYKSDLRM